MKRVKGNAQHCGKVCFKRYGNTILCLLFKSEQCWLCESEKSGESAVGKTDRRQQKKKGSVTGSKRRSFPVDSEPRHPEESCVLPQSVPRLGGIRL